MALGTAIVCCVGIICGTLIALAIIGGKSKK